MSFEELIEGQRISAARSLEEGVCGFRAPGGRRDCKSPVEGTAGLWHEAARGSKRPPSYSQKQLIELPARRAYTLWSTRGIGSGHAHKDLTSPSRLRAEALRSCREPGGNMSNRSTQTWLAFLGAGEAPS